MAEVKRVKASGSMDDVRVRDDKKGVRLDDVFESFSLTAFDGKWEAVRFIGGLVGTATHWLVTAKNDGDLVKIPKTCLKYDVEKMDFDDDRECPYCTAFNKFKEKNIKVKVNGQDCSPAALNVEYFTNCIPRRVQEDVTPKIASDEERESGLINKDSKSRTPVRVMRLTGGLAGKLKGLKKLNVHLVKTKDKKTGVVTKERQEVALSHPVYGIDVYLKYDSKAATAANKYECQKHTVSPLTKEEEAYLRWDIESWPYQNEAEDLSTAKTEMSRMRGKHWQLIGVSSSKDSSDDEDLGGFEGGKKSKKSKKEVPEPEPVKGKKSKKADSVPFTMDDDLDDLDEKPKKKKKGEPEPEPVKGKKAKKETIIEDDDLDTKPSKKTKKVVEQAEEVVAKKGKKAKVVEEPVEDVKPSKKGKKAEPEPEPEPAKKGKKDKKSKGEDEPADTSILDDLDEKPGKKGGKADAKPGKKSKKAEDEDDDLPF